MAYVRSFFDCRTNEPSKSLGLQITYSKKKISVKRSKGVKTEAKANHKTYQEEKLSGKQKVNVIAWIVGMNILAFPFTYYEYLIML